MFVNARREPNGWRLIDSWGHAFDLPCGPTLPARVGIGTVGTRFESPGRAGAKSKVMARMLAALDRPIYLLDTRRSGTGAQSSWSPEEFATLIPEAMGGPHAYAFLHLPVLAPSIATRDASKRHEVDWHGFRDRYARDLTPGAVAVARAFVEAAAHKGGLAIFLCAEQVRPDFTELAPDDQEKHHCHRFHLVRRVADAIRADHPNKRLERVDLDPGAFAVACLAERSYEPLTAAL